MNIILIIFVFGFMIFFHELGHFLVAKACKIRVNEFALGMGPAILKFRKGETQYALRLFPIGGFVSMEGENEESSDARAFCNAKLYQRMAVTVVGSAMNLLLGFLIVLGMTIGQETILSNTVGGFAQGIDPATQSLQVGDRITKINGNRVLIENDMVSELFSDDDFIYDFTVVRDGKTLQLTDVILGKADDKENIPNITFGLAPCEKTLGNVLTYSVKKSVSIARMIWLSLGDLFGGRVALDQMSGPVGIAGIINDAYAKGFMILLNIVAFLTINIGIFNLLPIPALDGGRLLFQLIELVCRKSIPAKYEAYVHAAGLLLLLGFVIFITFHDILRLLGIGV